MYFSLIRMRQDIAPKELAMATQNNSYQAHKLVWNLFADSPDRKRDFLFRQEADAWPTMYTVSARPPHDQTGIWDVQTKKYFPQFKTGQMLEFLLRANPITSRRDSAGKQHRHDVIMNAKMAQKERGEKIHEADIVQIHGGNWLLERAKTHGFTVSEEYLRVDGYRQHRFVKQKGARPVTFSTVEIHGIITVFDPEKFVTCLYHGLGPAKSFGCGLLLVKNVRGGQS